MTNHNESSTLEDITSIKPNETQVVLESLDHLKSGDIIPEELWKKYFDPELISMFDDILKPALPDQDDLEHGEFIAVWGSSAQQLIFGGAKVDNEGNVLSRNVSDYDIKVPISTRLATLLHERYTGRGRTVDNVTFSSNSADLTHIQQLGSLNKFILQDHLINTLAQYPANTVEEQTRLGARIRAIEQMFESGPAVPKVEEILAKDVLYAHEVNSVVFRKGADGNLEARVIKPAENLQPIIHKSYRAEIIRQLAHWEEPEVVIDTKEIVRVAEVAGRAVKYCAKTDKDIDFEACDPSDYAALQEFTKKVIKNELAIMMHPDALQQPTEPWDADEDLENISVNERIRTNLKNYLAQGFATNPTKAVEYGFAKLPLGFLFSEEFAMEFANVDHAKIITEKNDSICKLLYGGKAVDLVEASTGNKIGIRNEFATYPTNMTQVMAIVMKSMEWDPEKDAGKIRHAVENWNNIGKEFQNQTSGNNDFDSEINVELLMMGLRNLRQSLP